MSYEQNKDRASNPRTNDAQIPLRGLMMNELYLLPLAWLVFVFFVGVAAWNWPWNA